MTDKARGPLFRGYQPGQQGYQPKAGPSSPKPPTGGSAVSNQPLPQPAAAPQPKK